MPSYQTICDTLLRKFTIAGKSSSCVSNYLRQASKLTIFYGKSPLDLSIDELEEYLYHLHVNEKSSLSSFKHLVYGLKHIYAMFGKEELHLSLPEIGHSGKLPVVFSQQEIRLLLAAPKKLKHKVMIGIIYDGGLRISELVNLKISDVDKDRKMLHIRESKFKKDRYVPISDMALRGIDNYISSSCPKTWLFNGKARGGQISREGVRHAFRSARQKTGIKKQACIHTLRHSYATHLLEMGLDLVSLKDQMGHVNISTTMMYLHIAQVSPTHGFSPLSRLYNGSGAK